MQLLRFFLALAVTAALTVLASWHQPFGSPLPAVGTFFSPFGGFWQNTVQVGKYDNVELSFPELEGGVEVVIDQRGVPHIFASTLADALYVQGYLEARDRLWQMDISNRATIGRLSEVLGERTLQRDKEQRRKGLLWAAENALRAWEQQPEEMAMINAYCAGANAWLEQLSPAKYPIEFKLLGYEPEPWTPLKTAAFFQSMAQSLNFRHDDLAATNTRQLLGDSLFRQLYPEHDPAQSPIIPESVPWDFQPASGDSVQAKAPVSKPMMSGLLPHRSVRQPSPFIGSNNWAVAGSKTASGQPILCNDPHLQLSLPSIWYELQLHTPELNAYGVSFPGIPGIIIGFNEEVAWGVTNVGHDVVDWYRMDWANPQKTAYRFGGQEKPVREVVEVIQVRGREEPVRDTVKYTEWGPVVYADPAQPGADLAMHWLAHELPEDRPFFELGAFYRLMKAGSLGDYKKALQGWAGPAQNFAFASRQGDIALTVNGKLPLKEPQQGRFVRDGADPSAGWNGFIPYAHLPRVINPERGFVASANQRSTTPGYPYYYNGKFDHYRGRYLNRRLDSLQQITVEDMKALQLDNYSLKAEEGAPLLLSLLEQSAGGAPEHEALQLLRNWDYRFEEKAEAPAFFERWWTTAYRLSFDELDAMREETNEVLMPESWRFFDLLEEAPQHAIFDYQATAEQEQASDIVRMALDSVLQDYEPQAWQDYMDPFIRHLGRISAFNRMDLPTGGYHDALNAVDGGKGPSWRMIVELGEQPKAYGIYPGGASGNPGSPFYDLMVDDWAAGRYHELQLMKQAGDESVNPLYQMTFKPAS